MHRYMRSPLPRHHDADNASSSDLPSSTFDNDSECSSQGSPSSLSSSLCAVARSPSSTRSVLEECIGRVFEIASEAIIDDVAYELADLIEGSTRESASILHAIQMLIDSGASNAEYARSIALIAEELYMQLVAFDDAVAQVFKGQIGTLGVDKFMEAWELSDVPDSGAQVTDGTPSDRGKELLRVSVFIGDLYATGLVTPKMLKDCIRTISAQGHRETDQPACMLAILSRANSYMGAKLSFEFLEEIACQLGGRHDRVAAKPERDIEELDLLIRFVDELLRNSLSIQNIASRHCTIPYAHVVNPRFCTSRIIVDASEHLEQMYDLHRDLSSTSSDSSDSPTPARSPFSTVMTMPETRAMKLDLEDGSSSSSSDGESDLDLLEELKVACRPSDSLSLLDIDFEEGAPAFAKEGLILSLNGAVPHSLTTSLPSRE